MRSFSGPNTANFKSTEETQMPNFEGKAITVASADEYLDLAAPATEEARKAANDYIETYFGCERPSERPYGDSWRGLDGCRHSRW
jgi:hypothetical protein